MKKALYMQTGIIVIFVLIIGVMIEVWPEGKTAYSDKTYIVSPYIGITFNLVGISDEFARGVSTGLSMTGLFKESGMTRESDREFRFYGKFFDRSREYPKLVLNPPCPEGYERVSITVFGVHRDGCYPADFNYDKANGRLAKYLMSKKEAPE